MKKVLVVDDEISILTLLEYNLTQAGYQVETAGDGEQAYKLIRENKALQNPDGTSKCTVMVGGAVLTKEYAEKIGADFYCRDAKEAVDTAKKVIG